MLINDLVLLHHSGSSDQSFIDGLDPNEEWFQLKTCLRSFVVGWRDWDFKLPEDPNTEVLLGAPAYQRILEIICGLHSPLFGETEVFGQFKQATAEFESSDQLWNSWFKKLFRQLTTDAKVVRKNHLLGRGGQSYGSVVRRETRDLQHMHIIGAGQLVKEMLPWLTKTKGDLKVHCRTPEKVQAFINEFPKLRVESLLESTSMAQDSSVLVVAAPMSSHEILEWSKKRNFSPELVIDLRGECEADPITHFSQVIDLKGVFAKIKSNKEKQKNFRIQAQKEILDLTASRAKEIEYKPFGWDDLCQLTS